ncbi:MAG TPA: alpha/beta hydrolase [Rhodanobacteraceae bacterium]|nr:alpha/beta hydrolase [Rhodanobacteraceae bacterium]
MREDSFLGLSTGGFHRVAYTEWGDEHDERLAICVHGLTRNGRDFDELAMALQKKRRVACPDIVGRGRSDWLADKSQYNFITYCADMTAMLARLRGSSVDWIGTSMGGQIGMILAAQPNTPIGRLVLNDIGPFVPKEAPRRLLAYAATQPAPFASIADAERYIREIYAPFGKLSDAQWAHITRHSLKEIDGGRYALAYDPGIVEPLKDMQRADFHIWPLWDRIHCPVLVLRGKESDVLLESTLDEMKRRGPHIDVVEIDGVGHAPSLTDAKHVRTVRDWLLG